MKTIKIENDVRDVLVAAECEGNALRLTGQLDRALYLKTNKILEAIGGKWNKKVKAHLFKCEAEDLVDQALLTGEVRDVVSEKVLYQAFYTPEELARQVVEVADIAPEHLVLEPSAGVGNLLTYIKTKTDFPPHACELHANSQEVLKANGYNVVAADFLTYNPGAIYDRVVANPPFTKRQDVQHVAHMLDCVKPGGRVISVMSPAITFATDRKVEELRERLRSGAWQYEIQELPEESFASSGTNVRTVLLIAERGRE